MKIKDLFDIKYGVNLELLTCETTAADDIDGINFVARTANNNGVVAIVKKIEGVTPQAAGTLSCAAGGSVLETFVQTKPYYSGRDLYILTPKNKMSLVEKLYYCMCIKANAYKYNYGRQANKTLKDIELPGTIPKWIYNTAINPIKTANAEKQIQALDVNKWGKFVIGDFFTVRRGKRIVRGRDYFTQKTDEYCYRVITSTKQNNGVDGYFHSFNCPANSIVCGGEAAGFFTTYQAEKCWVMDRARIFTPKKEILLNKYIALFLATIFSCNQYKYSYGRTPNPSGIEETTIKLPVTNNGSPDWAYMEHYIKSLPYSDRI